MKHIILFAISIVFSAITVIQAQNSNTLDTVTTNSFYKSPIDKARELRLNGDVDEAEAIYNSIIEKNGRDVDALVGRGFCRTRKVERLDEALADFQNVIVMTPGYVDAYIGAAVVLKRKGENEKADQMLTQCEQACESNTNKLRYLAESAWRESFFPIARKIDKNYGMTPERKLIPHPNKITPSCATSWLETGPDWDMLGLDYSYRSMPDTTWYCGFEEWWRYDTTDWTAQLGASHRRNNFWSANYFFDFSDIPGFLAEQKHSATVNMRVYRSTIFGIGPRLAKYNGHWSKKMKVSLTQNYRNWFADYSYSFGRDSHDHKSGSHALSTGYNLAQQLSLTVGVSTGDETVETGRAGHYTFRSDTVDSFFVRSELYLTGTMGVSAAYLIEDRNSDLFRREARLSAFKMF